MAPSKKKGATASASKKAPVSPRPVAKTHDGRPTRAEKSAANKARYKAEFKAVAAELSILHPKSDRTLSTAASSTGKPTEFTEDIGQKICLAFATDPSFSLMRMNVHPDYPSIYHFYKWLLDHPHFDKCYTRAREIQTDLQAAEMEEWAEKPLVGRKVIKRTKSSDNGDEVTEEVQEYDNIERARLRTSTRQWLLAKYRPRKYGIQPISVESGSEDALAELLSQFRQRNQEIEGA